MKKNTLLFIVLYPFLQLAFSQTPVWHYENMGYGIIRGYVGDLKQYDNKYYFGNGGTITEVIPEGYVTGFTGNMGTGFYLGGSFFKKNDPVTGEMYFFSAFLQHGAPVRTIPIMEYRPNKGSILLHSFPTASAFSANRPVHMVWEKDNDYVLFSSDYVRHITHQVGKGIKINWEKQLYQGPINSGIVLGDKYIVGCQNGNILALGVKGDSLWMVTLPHSVRSMQAAPLGFIAVGAASGISYLRPDGSVIWSKVGPENVYENLAVASDGSFVVTGRSESINVLLAKYNANGEQLWRRDYNTGIGGNVIKTSDGGFLVTGEIGIKSFIMKTDEMGVTSNLKRFLGHTYRTLENHNIILEHSVSSLHINNFSSPKFSIPKDSLWYLAYQSSLWLTATDKAGEKYFSGKNGLTTNAVDIRPGLATTTAKVFERPWLIKRREIEALRADWADNGKLDQYVPHDILTWPARENPEFKQNFDFSTLDDVDKSRMPAPFVDVNNDGKYNVHDGDFPMIKGDQMAWFVLTDSATRVFSHLPGMNIDICVSSYLFDCQGDTISDNTMFVDYELSNNSRQDYTDMYVGLLNDFDLGCYEDDYMGCIPDMGTCYAYNADSVDGNPGNLCSGATATMGDKPGVISNTFLYDTLACFVTGMNIGLFNGSLPQDRQMKEGNFLVVGKPKTMFSGNPSDKNEISMCSKANIIGDYRSLSSTGPFELPNGSKYLFSTAISYHQNIPHPCPDINSTVKKGIEKLRATAQSGALSAPPKLSAVYHLKAGDEVNLGAEIQGAQAYEWSTGENTSAITVKKAGTYTVTITRATGCTMVEFATVKLTSNTLNNNAVEPKINIYPNPASASFTVEITDIPKQEATLRLHDAMGRVKYQSALNITNGQAQHIIHRNHQLPAGIYFLEIQDSGYVLQGKKVVLR